MAVTIGVLLPLSLCSMAAIVRLDRDRALYPTMLIVIAFYYVLFAVMGGGGDALLLEIGVAAVFIAAAIAGFTRNLWIVVGATAAHGLFDLMHGMLFENPGVPIWWPAFCSAADVAIAGFLGILLVTRPGHARPAQPEASAR